MDSDLLVALHETRLLLELIRTADAAFDTTQRSSDLQVNIQDSQHSVAMLIVHNVSLDIRIQRTHFFLKKISRINKR
jgi:hypothetical protein